MGGVYKIFVQLGAKKNLIYLLKHVIALSEKLKTKTWKEIWMEPKQLSLYCNAWKCGFNSSFS